MNAPEELILKQLKQELEFNLPAEDYSQWVMGLSVKPLNKTNCIVRVVVRTSQSPYVDGTDYTISIIENTSTTNTDDLEEDPIFHGGTIEDALNWLKEHSEPCYLQLENPFFTNTR